MLLVCQKNLHQKQKRDWGDNKAGYHACEIRSRNVERELLEGLIPQIEEEAQKIAKLYAK